MVYFFACLVGLLTDAVKNNISRLLVAEIVQMLKNK